MKDKTRITIDGKRFMADTSMVGLLKELNKHGFKTLYHCDGVNNGRKYFSLDLNALSNVWVAPCEGVVHIHLRAEGE